MRRCRWSRGWRHTLACTASGKLCMGVRSGGAAWSAGVRTVTCIIEVLSREKVNGLPRAHFARPRLAYRLLGAIIPMGVRSCGRLRWPRQHYVRNACSHCWIIPIVDLQLVRLIPMFVSLRVIYLRAAMGFGQLCAPPELLTAGTHLQARDGILVQEPCLVPLGQRVLGPCGAYHTVLLMRSEALRDPPPTRRRERSRRRWRRRSCAEPARSGRWKQQRRREAGEEVEKEEEEEERA